MQKLPDAWWPHQQYSSLCKPVTIIYPFIYKNNSSMLFDISGTFLSLLSTYYYIQMDKKAWAVTMIAACVNGSLYWKSGIYANSVLEIFYFFNACYGWLHWKKMDETAAFTLGRYQLRQYMYLAFIGLAVFLLLNAVLKTQSHSVVPTLDALTSSLSVIAQWLMSKKIIFTWLLWFITDALYALMYYTKALPFHALLFVFFTGLAIAGYIRWSKLEQPILQPLNN